MSGEVPELADEMFRWSGLIRGAAEWPPGAKGRAFALSRYKLGLDCRAMEESLRSPDRAITLIQMRITHITSGISAKLGGTAAAVTELPAQPPRGWRLPLSASFSGEPDAAA